MGQTNATSQPDPPRHDSPRQDSPRPDNDAPAIAVFSPALLTSVTVEQNADGRDEIHIHPAGQGYWVARMLAALGAHPILCATISGELAELVSGLVEPGIEVRTVASAGPSGAYVDDRRSGQRQRLAEQRAPVLDRHELDDLTCATVAAAVETGTLVVTGSNLHGSIAPEVYRSLTTNVHELGASVVVDLSGAELAAALDGEVDVIKIAHDELPGERSDPDDDAAIAAAAAQLHGGTGADVFVTCAGSGALAHTSTGVFTGSGPRLVTTDHRGAGDSFTAAVTLARVLRLGPADQLRLAIAAGATNVLRHGLGSATLEAVRAVAKLVEVTEAGPVPAAVARR